MREGAHNEQNREEWEEWYGETINLFHALGFRNLSPNTEKLIYQELVKCLNDKEIGMPPGEVMNRVVWYVAGVNLKNTPQAEKNKHSFWDKIHRKLASY